MNMPITEAPGALADADESAAVYLEKVRPDHALAIKRARHRVDHGDLAFNPRKFRDIEIDEKSTRSPRHVK
jgi:hypothetical protein